MEPDPDRVSLRKTFERNLLYRPPVKRVHEDAVVRDLAAADVDAVMGKAETRRNEVRAQRWLFVSRQKPITPAQSSESAALFYRPQSIGRPTVLLRIGTIES